jgi:hypothetical protein
MGDVERQSLPDSSPPRRPFIVIAADDATVEPIDGVKRGLTATLADDARLFVDEYFHRLLLACSFEQIVWCDPMVDFFAAARLASCRLGRFLLPGAREDFTDPLRDVFVESNGNASREATRHGGGLIVQAHMRADGERNVEE